MSLGGGGGGSSTTVQKTEPWEGQKPYLTDLYSKAQGLYYKPGPEYYPYSTVAQYDPMRVAGDALAVDAAGRAMMTSNQAQGGLTNLMGAADVLSNPFFGQALQASLNPVIKNYQEQILPGIDSAAYTSGAYSNTRLPLVKAQAADAANQAMLDTAARFGSAAYGQGLNALAQGVSMAPNIMASMFVPTQQLQQAGAMRQAQAQAELDDAVARFQHYQLLPYTKLSEYATIVGGSSPGATSYAQTMSKSGGNPGLAAALMMLPFLPL